MFRSSTRDSQSIRFYGAHTFTDAAIVSEIDDCFALSLSFFPPYRFHTTDDDDDKDGCTSGSSHERIQLIIIDSNRITKLPFQSTVRFILILLYIFLWNNIFCTRKH